MDSEPRRLTTRMTDCRLLIESKPTSGSWNMAVDEVLLESAIERNLCSVRIYRWCTATVSLGYFQKAAAISDAPCLHSLPVVRRLSGGGAILHHHEITYSCSVPARHILARQPHKLYWLVHSAINHVLATHGITAAIRGKSQQQHKDSFLCFSRGDPNDIVLHGCKIVGSAQRRRRGAILQHGSLIVQKSLHAPEIAGLLDLSPTNLDVQDSLTEHLGDELGDAISELMGRVKLIIALDQTESSRAIELRKTKYSPLEWQGP